MHVSLFDYAKKLNEYGNNYVYSCNDVACGLVAGYINDFQNHEAYIQVLIVAYGYQGKGIGTSLITRFLEDARLILGYGKVFLTADKSNIKAQKLYRKLGFVESNRIHINAEQKLIMEYLL